MKILSLITISLLLTCCQIPEAKRPKVVNDSAAHQSITEPSLVILGTVQDAGSPHIACIKDCCKNLFNNPDKDRKVVSLGLIDPENKMTYLFEATPDMPEQMKLLKKYASFNDKETPEGIFITHAHIGHYTGLMYLGKEAMNADKVPVYAMPRMKGYLETNGPWSQLVNNKNIKIQPIQDQQSVELTSNFSVTPILVPHRDEYSETVGYIINGPNKKVLFIPDIDKWEKWNKSIIDMIKQVDHALLDASFYDADEINNRDISEIPHPFVIESMELFDNLSNEEKKKIYFIHFNHTNPLLTSDSKQHQLVMQNGFNVAKIKDVIAL